MALSDEDREFLATYLGEIQELLRRILDALPWSPGSGGPVPEQQSKTVCLKCSTVFVGSEPTCTRPDCPDRNGWFKEKP